MLKLFNSQRLLILIIVFITFITYVPLFQNSLVIDDRVFISKDYLDRLNPFNAISGFVPEGHEGVYRPVRSLLYWLYYQIFGLNLVGWHLHALVVHLSSTILVYLIAKKLTKNIKIAFFASVFFGVYPVHVESIAYTAASMEIAGFPLMLGSFYLFLNSRKTLSLFLALLAFFTYEMTLTLPALVLVYEFLLGRKKFFKSWPYFGLLIGYLFLRFFQQGIVSRGGYPGGNMLFGFAFSVIEIFNYLRLSLIPYPLTHNHIFTKGVESILYRGNVITQGQVIGWEFLISSLSLVVLLWLAVYFWKRLPLITFCLVWFLVTLIPSLTVIPQGTILHEKFLYLPSLGVSLILAYLLHKSRVKWLLVLIFFVLTFTRIFDWRSDLTLWSKDIELSPTKNAYAYFQRGNSYVSLSQVDLAIEDYKRAFLINPHFAVAIASSAKLWQQQNLFEKALESYQKSIQADNNFWEGWFNLGNIYFQENKLDHSGDAYIRVAKINPGFKPALDNLQAVIDKLNQEQDTFTDSKISFKYPRTWMIDKHDRKITLSNQTGSFKLTFNLSDQQMPMDGQIINQGLAQIPSVHSAKVVVWSSNSLQFFLTKGSSTIEVVVTPSDSPMMKVFDRIISSLEISN